MDYMWQPMGTFWDARCLDDLRVLMYQNGFQTFSQRPLGLAVESLQAVCIPDMNPCKVTQICVELQRTIALSPAGSQL